MRKLLSIIFTSFLALLFLNNCQKNPSESKDSLKDLEAGFANPSSEYRTAPLAVWNSKVTNAEVERTIQELKDAGFGGLFVHPRPGLITEYMSEEWYSLYKHAIDCSSSRCRFSGIRFCQWKSMEHICSIQAEYIRSGYFYYGRIFNFLLFHSKG